MSLAVLHLTADTGGSFSDYAQAYIREQEPPTVAPDELVDARTHVPGHTSFRAMLGYGR
jgi:hypothetical protein